MFGAGQQIDLETGEIGVHSTPAVVKDVVIVGSSFREGATVSTHNNTKGLVRAFDVRIGQAVVDVQHHSTPGRVRQRHMGERDSWAVNGNTGVWTQITVDEDLGLVYLPVETPTSDFYGGHRPGNNLFAESLVCVDLKTGQRKWHFQLVHHPLWNYDMSSAPILADITVNGRAIKAVAVPGKQAFLFVFDRVTGQPVWPIEERPVPQSDVPGEKTSPTQPFPDQTAGVCPQHAEGARRPHRLHAGAARAGDQESSSATRSRRGCTTRRCSATSTASSARSTWGTRSAAPTGRASPTIRRRTRSSPTRTTSASRRVARPAAAELFGHPLRVGRRGAAVPGGARTWRLLRGRFAARAGAGRGAASAGAPAAPATGVGGGLAAD